MRFECGDLDRALAAPELMPEAKAHLKNCAPCRAEYRLWNSISAEARGMHEDWETPHLWGQIECAIRAEPKTRKDAAYGWTARGWKFWAVAAACLVTAGLFVYLRRDRGVSTIQSQTAAPTSTATAPAGPSVASTATQDFLTDEALRDVEQREQAYRTSIDKLSRIAQTKLTSAPPALAVNYREKLLLLDSAIADTRETLEHNRFNVRLQTDLADLYREKQLTLRELVTRDRKN